MSRGSLEDEIAERRDLLVSLLNLERSQENRFPPPGPFDADTISSVIDHTLLKPDATSSDVENLCRESMENNFRAVCVNPLWAPKAFSIIETSSVRLCCVVGFPLGASFTKIKAMEAQLAIEAGADEIDMVIPIGKLKEHDLEYMYNDIHAVVQTASKQNSRRGNKVLVKVILEICLLSGREIIDGAIVSELAGAHFVKTSTGFSTGGATVEAVKIIKSVVGNRALVKASGGVRTLEAARMYIEAGVSRIGTSSGITIVNETQGSLLTDTHPLCNDSSQGNQAAY